MGPQERVEALISKGESALATHRPNSPGVIGFPTLDSGAFTEWRTQAVAFLTELLGSEHPYTLNFNEQVQRGFRGSAEAGIGILKAVSQDLASGHVEIPTPRATGHDAIGIVTRLCERFHIVARQLRARHTQRHTLDVKDEHDVQDLLHALLRLEFDDVRTEEYTPSYAGKSSRMDFLLKQHNLVIECKRSSANLGAKQLGTQLIEDTARYNAHQDCQTLICFTYDPEGHIANPSGIEADLSRTDSDPRVVVLIRPQ
jgi:hypothetical protein